MSHSDLERRGGRFSHEDDQEIDLVDGPATEPALDPDSPESRERDKITFIKAVCGELLCTTLFLYIVMANGINFARSQAGPDTVSISNPVVGAVCTGFCAVALIYSFADVSGAHFNPAVTFATVITRKTTPVKGLAYLVAQLLGSVVATFLLWIVFPDNGDVSAPMQAALSLGQNVSRGQAFLTEVIQTFILIYVIFAVAFDTLPAQRVQVGGESGNSRVEKKRKLTIYTTSGQTKAGFAPIAIGFTLGFLCFLGGTVSGGAFNPARAFGPSLLSGQWDNHWIYWVGDLLGAGLAGYTQLFFGARNQMWCASPW